MNTSWDAVILAGGRSSRLGGVAKPQLVFEGRSLLQRALEATAAAGSRVVVGDGQPDRPGVSWVQEVPRWGGPAAAIAAGVSALPENAAGVVVVLAADLPHVRRALPLVTDRVDASEEWDGWMASDPQGRPQPLLAAYRSTSLARRCAQLHEQGALTGASVRLLVTGLRLCAVAVPAELCRDVDTPADAEHFAIALSTSQEAHDRLIPAYAER